MDNGFPFFDIILFALIAGFIILRLRSVLGRRDGHEGGYRDPFKEESAPGDDKVVTLRNNDAEKTKSGTSFSEEDTSSPAAELRQIREADPNFDEGQFMQGARMAFEMIVDAFAAGDRETLGALLSEDVMASFDAVIRDRESRQETMDHDLVGLNSAELVEADLKGKLAKITVKFVSEQVNLTKNSDGDVVDGDPDTIATVTDFWTFQRDIRDRNPNWILSATHSLD